LTDRIETRRNLIRAELQRVDGIDPNTGPAGFKHRKMAENPMSFLRGSAQLFYTDIAQGVLELPGALLQTPPLTVLVGDCHVSNFGFITEQGSYSDRVVFCPNDYDDACIGPAVWDLARFLVSLLLAADYCRGILSGDYSSDEVGDTTGLRAASSTDAVQAAKDFLDAYLQTCRQSVSNPEMHTGALDRFPKKHVLGPLLRKARRRAAGGADFETKSTLGKEVEIHCGRPRFRDRPDRFALLDPDRDQAVRHAFRPYVDDSILDLVQRLGAGTGSVELDRFYLLVGPAGFCASDDLHLCHVVEIKQQRRAAALFRFPVVSPVNNLNPAHLTLDCQRLMQRSPDLVLDEVFWDCEHWLVRSRHHARVGVDPEDIALAEKKPGKRLAQYATACGEALALAHARGDRRSSRFEVAMAKHLKIEADALIAAACDYAGQVKEDRCHLERMLCGNAPGVN